MFIALIPCMNSVKGNAIHPKVLKDMLIQYKAFETWIRA